MDCRVLANGVKIPMIGYGCWKSPDTEETSEAVKTAIVTGYRHIDGAAAYGNEKSVGKGIADGLKEAGLKREDLFVTSKLWNTEHGYESTLAAFRKTLDDLQLDYLDLYLIHWPNPAKFRDCYVEKNIETWKAFEELYKAGKIRAIGVSNFLPRHMEEIRDTMEVFPMVNQIEFHPSCLQPEVRAYCAEHNIAVEGYCPLANGKVFQVEEVHEIAAAYGKTAAQVVLRWSIQHDVIPLPKSLKAERMKSNMDVFDFELNRQDMDRMDQITGCWCMGHDPDNIAF